MIDELMRRFLRKKKRKRFSAWQIELTTRCPLACRMCIRASADDWHDQEMALDDFKKILPYLNGVETVVLEGWGESLLHGNLVDCVRLAKAEGPEVGFVTSGMGITEKRVSDLIDAGLDFVGFSLAGTTLEVHNRIRVNSDLSEILRGIRWFQEVKTRRKLQRPKLHMVYLMLNDNLSEVSNLPELAHGLGISEIVLLNIIQVTSSWQDEQKIFNCALGKGDYDEMFKRVATDAQRLGITLRKPSQAAIDVPVCDENPLRNLYIAATGEVSPCVYLFPPVGSPFKRIYCGQEYLEEKVSFGNIFKEPFSSIWDGVGYVRFRESFLARQKFFRDRRLALLDMSRLAELRKGVPPGPPVPCRTCHKMLGV
jgi:MoaA/NifB/PqqE/SkfB family radical SAM enzyme